MGRLARRSRGRRRESRGGEGSGVKLEELGTSQSRRGSGGGARGRGPVRGRCSVRAVAPREAARDEEPVQQPARCEHPGPEGHRPGRRGGGPLRGLPGAAEALPFCENQEARGGQQADSFASALTMVDHLSQDTKATAAILAGDAEGLQSLLKESDESGNRHTAQRSGNRHTAQRVQLVLKKMTAPYNWHTRFQQWEREKRMMDCQASLQRIEQLRRLEENREREQEAFHKAWMFQKHVLTVSKEDAIQEYKKAISEMAGQRRMDAEVRRSLQGLERCWIDNFSTKKPWTPSLTGPQALQHFCKRMTCKRCNPKDWKWAEEAPMENIAEHQFFMGIMHKTDKMLKTRICENPVAHMCGHCSESDEHCHREKE
eukprot:CAMPEP_0177619296 /NCGR_PEP_ID=MMETSP0419_2-20121207/26166_1 /TAXON_ID=582737 /ORGANISM="Tetraselmis sp., Strain GSL018" /LENGTH=371 /DNA_ID=CAMNT_0019118517 /DNA_START=82 /DNA_END=1198 /DNA_ORIENTATION=+